MFALDKFLDAAQEPVSILLPTSSTVEHSNNEQCNAANPTCCGGKCTDLSSDISNCGACSGVSLGNGTGTVCAGIVPQCCSGECTDIALDVNNCGTCSKKVLTVILHQKIALVC
ncbi:hypothetical protein F1880_010031 [Penicillium rolfsii]|nr:hypothetical protein F1880_010031 [Penicillium rolfsii]